MQSNCSASSDKTATLCAGDRPGTPGTPGTPTLVHVIPRGSVDAGVESLELYDDKLFVGRETGAQVEVYDATTWSLQRRLSIVGLGDRVYGLAACDYNKCLYVSDNSYNCVHTVDLSTYDVVLKWSVAAGPWGLSINAARGVLVACNGANRIQEYSLEGSLKREICITGLSPFHGIRMSDEQILVSHYGSVSTIGTDGRVINSYGDRQRSEDGQLSYP